ncbi:hypothetical protein BC739_003982 [Kutzneria viridogrisea]|uniref:Uncharacterized protein n=2 Tax=Kutzneria TaxID=43356 RepID=W5W5H8_9PSEU|nr:hypothetical protein KALB_2338 [Kutzneria albida DSM 43870]MBA8926776.1 hypothetical protein [Kutzneria viridogrisea]
MEFFVDAYLDMIIEKATAGRTPQRATERATHPLFPKGNVMSQVRASLPDTPNSNGQD